MGRDEIDAVLRRLNEIENERPRQTVADVIAGIDTLMAANVEGWANGVHTPDREAERQTERMLFEALVDYHRSFDRVIIDPPLASVAWTITATVNGSPITVPGCTNFEFDDNAQIRRYWLYFDASPFSALAQ